MSEKSQIPFSLAYKTFLMMGYDPIRSLIKAIRFKKIEQKYNARPLPLPEPSSGSRIIKPRG